ncbi:EexN family lipoprotein [Escherichia albertii]|nr:EexN family lipoprotein [Escherichia albertii]
MKMKTILSFLVLSMVSLFLTGCFEETKSRDWWEEHPKQAAEKVAECQKSGSDSDNCNNAKQGLFRYQQAHATPPSYRDMSKKLYGTGSTKN